MTEMQTKPESDVPGSLRNQASIEIHTRQAQYLVSPKPGQGAGAVGLLSFASRMRNLWQSAQFNDPYADWFLIQIEAAIEDARTAIKREVEELHGILGSVKAVRIGEGWSVQPVEIPLQFGHPYGYQAAYAIAEFDELSRLVLTARHCGLLDRDKAMNASFACAKALRRAFQLVTLWRYTGVNRKDLSQMNQLAARAKELMGDLPQDVAAGKRRAKHAPAIKEGPPVSEEDWSGWGAKMWRGRVTLGLDDRKPATGGWAAKLGRPPTNPAVETAPVTEG